jgi:phytanoyl-CoA hydroxylase
MNTKSTPQARRFGLNTDELSQWNQNGYLVRLDVFTPKENDALRQVAEDIVDGKRSFPFAHIDRNALVRDGKVEELGIYAMHKIHHPSCYCPEFLARVRDPRLTDPLVDLLGPDILGINNLFIWKAPKIGLGFPWHQDKFYFRNRFKTDTTIGTWTAIDAAERENGCLYVIPGSHKGDIFQHDDLDGSQQQEFKLARGVRDEDGVAVEVPPGAVIWFHSHLLHKSMDNHSLRFRRSYVSHYLSAHAEWARPASAGRGQPVMWIRGETFPDKVYEVGRDVLPVPESEQSVRG